MPDGQGPWPSAPARHRRALLPPVLDRALDLEADNRLGNLDSLLAHPAGKARVRLLRREVFIVERIIDGACGRIRHCFWCVWSTRAQRKLAGISDGAHEFRNLTISVEALWRSGLGDGLARCPTHRNMPMGRTRTLLCVGLFSVRAGSAGPSSRVVAMGSALVPTRHSLSTVAFSCAAKRGIQCATRTRRF